MQHKRIAFGLLAAFASLASADDKSDVHQLTEKTFDDFVKANPLVLAECKFLPCSPLRRPVSPAGPRWQLGCLASFVSLFIR